MKRLALVAALAAVVVLPGCFRPAGSASPTHKDDMTLAAYCAQMPDAPTTLTATCKLDNYYNAAYYTASKTHYSIAVRSEGDILWGYAAMDSEVGKSLYGLLKDGKERRLTVTLHRIDARGRPITDRTIRDCAIAAVAAP